MVGEIGAEKKKGKTLRVLPRFISNPRYDVSHSHHVAKFSAEPGQGRTKTGANGELLAVGTVSPTGSSFQ